MSQKLVNLVELSELWLFSQQIFFPLHFYENWNPATRQSTVVFNIESRFISYFSLSSEKKNRLSSLLMRAIHCNLQNERFQHLVFCSTVQCFSPTLCLCKLNRVENSFFYVVLHFSISLLPRIYIVGTPRRRRQRDLAEFVKFDDSVSCFSTLRCSPIVDLCRCCCGERSRA